MKHFLYGIVSDITSTERHLIQDQNVMIYKQEIMDIFSEYLIFESPTQKNIHNLTLKAARSALMKGPFYAT